MEVKQRSGHKNAAIHIECDVLLLLFSRGVNVIRRCLGKSDSEITSSPGSERLQKRLTGARAFSDSTALLLIGGGGCLGISRGRFGKP